MYGHTMELTRAVVEAKANEYRESAPLYAVERDHLEMLPDAFQSGEFGYRDAEWVVRWTFRRHLGAYPETERRDHENAYGDNDESAIRAALADALAAAEPADAVSRLTDLDGVDIRVASAFLFFAAPDDYVPVGEREWTVLHDAGVLSRPYPDSLTPSAYADYLDVCRSLADRFDCEPWTLYRALWQLGAAEE